MDDIDEALAAHEESLRLEPDSYDVRDNFGVTSWSWADMRLQLSISSAPLSFLKQTIRSGFRCPSYRALGQHDECISAARRKLERIEREISLRPDNAYAMVHGAVALAYLGERERAKEWASRAFTIEPDDPIDHYNLACALAQLDETDQALDLLEFCFRKAPPEHLAWIERDPDLVPLTIIRATRP